MAELSCFKAYDIRGKLGDELNEAIAYRIGRAFARVLHLGSCVVGGDARQTSVGLKIALARGMQDEGCRVLDIGMVGTEEIYFATSYLQTDGGVEVTASHNPIDFNGMKLVRRDSQPVSGDSGLLDIKAAAEQQPWLGEPAKQGSYHKTCTTDAYIQHLLGYIDTAKITPIKLLVNAGNGAAGHIIDALEQQFIAQAVPIEFVKIHHQPDANFPNGIPNPLLPQNRQVTTDAVRKHGADMGIAWDGDFDRCFLFDENGEFVEGYYIVGLLAAAFLQKQPGKIIYDPRLTWNTQEIVADAGGTAIMCKTGHAFIKERMRQEDAIYGGEMSAHHYFKDFFYCDSGMIPWLLVVQLLCTKQQKLSQMLALRIAKFPTSGEINTRPSNPNAAIAQMLAKYQPLALKIDKTDGIGIEFANWRFNLRLSNTEPVVRLNVESRADFALMQKHTQDILALLRS